MLWFSPLLIIGLCLAYTGSNRHVFNNRLRDSLRKKLKLVGWSLVLLGTTAYLISHGLERGLVDSLALIGLLGVLLVLVSSFFGPGQRRHKS